MTQIHSLRRTLPLILSALLALGSVGTQAATASGHPHAKSVHTVKAKSKAKATPKQKGEAGTHGKKSKAKKHKSKAGKTTRKAV